VIWHPVSSQSELTPMRKMTFRDALIAGRVVRGLQNLHPGIAS
jgi:hypothetical protein